MPSCDLCVPTRDRAADLARSLPALLTTARALGGRLLVCDQSAVAGSVPGAELYHAPQLDGLPAARNALLRRSRADWVLFCDDDSEPAADFAARLDAAIAAAPPDLVALGPVVETRSRTLRRGHRLLQLGCFRDPRRLCARPADLPTRALFGCCFAVRRQPALRTGFDASRTGYALGEDLDFFLRLPGRKRFLAALRCRHRESGAGRDDPRRRAARKVALIRWLAARHGRGNPATLLHSTLALLGAASGKGRMATRPGAVLEALLVPSRSTVSMDP